MVMMVEPALVAVGTTTATILIVNVLRAATATILIVNIWQAMRSSQNKVECDNLARRLPDMHNLLLVRPVQGPNAEKVLARLRDALKDAQELVDAFQNLSALRKFTRAYGLARRFRKVNHRIGSSLDIIHFLGQTEMDHNELASELEALEQIISDANAEPIKLSYGLLRSITDNFSNEIGRGGFGTIYKGVLQNGDVSVKKLLNLHALPEKQFLDEITCFKKAKHKNIVRFLGYCSETQGELLEFNGKEVMGEAQQKLLCFEYVPNGNIKDYLQQEKSNGDDWPLRYQMIRGICQGLHYLHGKYINHLDLKPENVMLDAHLEPKITDFGLSRCLDQGQSKIITQNIVGTRRYIAPETIDNGEISLKSDIYALGILIIELLTGIDKISLDNWDESLDMDCPRAKRCAEIARNCTNRDRYNRPTISEVIGDLDELESMSVRSSINQGNATVFSWTDMDNVYPLGDHVPLLAKQGDALSHESDQQDRW